MLDQCQSRETNLQLYKNKVALAKPILIYIYSKCKVKLAVIIHNPKFSILLNFFLRQLKTFYNSVT